MLGAIIGDTVGSIYEFNNHKSTKFELFAVSSTPTDDSVMTMAVAEWLLSDPERTQDKLEECMLRWGNRYPHPQGGYGGAFCRWLFYPEFLGGRHPYNSWGNGSAMRCSACGWVAKTLSEAEDLAKKSAEITHNHPEGIKGAQAVAAAVWMSRMGVTKEELREYISTRFGYNITMTCNDIRPSYRFDASCQGTVPQAVVAFIESCDFESAIRLAVSLGGDSDTLTCITGAIAEAFYKDIPTYIIAEMHNRIDKDWWEIVEKIRILNTK
jgi:ADP-ribosylglycohydrolase